MTFLFLLYKNLKLPESAFTLEHGARVTQNGSRINCPLSLLKKNINATYPIKCSQPKSKNTPKGHPPCSCKLHPNDSGMVQYMKINTCNPPHEQIEKQKNKSNNSILWNSWVWEQVCLWFFCLLLGSFPPAWLPCPNSIWCFCFILLYFIFHLWLLSLRSLFWDFCCCYWVVFCFCFLFF